MMVERGCPTSRHPRAQFRMDLRQLLQQFQDQQHEILLIGDFNEDFDNHHGGGLRSVTGGLVDLMKVKIGHQRFSTYVMGQTRIDYALATPRVVAACTKAGSEPFRYRFETDHRGFFLDFDNSILFGNNATPTLASPPSRTLFSKSTKQ
jgi:endonuclease/exonuclease/phosphatase family metal-dependent hydrolase